MRWDSRFSISRMAALVSITLGHALAGGPDVAILPVPAAPTELSFMRGDTRNGAKIHIRILGDSVHFCETVYRPAEAPVETRKSAPLSAYRRKALNNVIGELPRYPAFGTCFGKGMRYYLVETEGNRFYRSVPENAGKCYGEEPGIWSLFQDLDDLLTPPADRDHPELPAS